MRGSSKQPQYLRGVSAAAQVDAAALWRFEALLEHSGDIAGIGGAVMNLSGAHFSVSVRCFPMDVAPSMRSVTVHLMAAA